MKLLKEELENISIRLISLLSQLKEINVINCTEIPVQISQAIVGKNKVLSYLNRTIEEVTESDLNNITSIDESAFYNCQSLTSITIPNSVTTIGNSAFYNCLKLTSITIPNSVTSIGNRAFYNCQRLTSITIPDSVTTIGDYAFYDCHELRSVTISNSITSIGNNTFNDCGRLTSITIPEGVTSIGNNAFFRCHELRSVTIPESVTTIGEDAFYNCTNLEKVYASDVESWLNIEFKSSPMEYAPAIELYFGGTLATDIVIPEGTTKIYSYAFYHCTSLISITIPESVKIINSITFEGCTNLTDIYLNSITPPALYNSNAIPTTTTIHVPAGSGEVYRNATNWSYHASRIIEDIEI